MDTTTTFCYKGATQIDFAYSGAFWVAEVDTASSVSVSVSKTQSIGQIGATKTAQTVEPRTVKIRGSYTGNVVRNRARLLEAVAPGVPATFTVTENGESWFLDGIPTKTPDCSDGQVLQEYQFTLWCPFPYWRSARRELTPISGLVSLFQTPFFTGGTWRISQIDRNYKNVLNTGNVEMPFDVVFRAATDLVNPEVYFVTQRKYIRLGTDAAPFSMLAGDVAEISTRDKTVWLAHADGTTENAFRQLDITSSIDATLLPGDNLVRRTAAQNADSLRAFIRRDMGVKSGL